MNNYFQSLNLEDQNRVFSLTVLKWFLVGLLLRLLIMPFSFHGHDIFWLNYFPFKFAWEKIYDPYLYIKVNLPDMKSVYYPPGILYILIFFQSLFKPLLPKLQELYSIFSFWNFTWQGNTINYADILTHYQLFRTLFLFKVPYLIADFLTGFILFELLKEKRRKALIALTVWAVNPFVIHSIYMLGQFDIIVAMFIMFSLLSIKMKKPYLAIVFMSLGATVKIIPLLLIPPILIICGKSVKEQIKLGIIAALCFFGMALPFYFSSGLYVFKIFQANFGISITLKNTFIAFYFAFLGIIYCYRRDYDDELDKATICFTVILLLFYSVYHVTLRHFVWITPLLILIALKNRVFWIYNVIFVITLFELRAAGNSQLWGLFAPIHPEFFTSLPILDSYINLVFNVKYLHQIMYRIFFISCLLMSIHILILNMNILKIPFSTIKIKNEKK